MSHPVNPPGDPSGDPPGAEVARRLHAAAIGLLRHLRRTDTATGVGPAQLSALSVLVFGGERSLGELADAEQVSPPTMSRVVKALEERGLVRRRTDPEDRRALRIAATARGRRVLEKGRRLRLAELRTRIARLDAADRAELARAVAVLERLNALR